jgi:hypothetical protein
VFPVQISIELTEEEKLEFEFRAFQYQGLQINFNQYLADGREYTDEHFNRITDTLLDKYAALQKCLYKILKNHGYKNIAIKSFDFFINENVLIIHEGR